VEFEEMLDSLGRVPTRGAMRTILSAHHIEQLAEEMQIERQLIHSAVAAGPRGVKLGDVYRTASGATKKLEELTPEENEEYLDSWAPFLPEPLRTEWKAKVDSTIDYFSKINEDTLIVEYEKYLKWVLDGYAVGTAKGNLHVASYNEIDPSGEGAIRKYKDTFWVRDVHVTKNPEHNPRELSAAASQTIDNKPRNPLYLIDIMFTPRQVQSMRYEGTIHFFGPEDFTVGVEGIWTVVDKRLIWEETGMAVEKNSWVAIYKSGTPPTMQKIAFGKTGLEALTNLVAPPAKPGGRPLTDEEKHELIIAASGGHHPVITEPVPPLGEGELTAEIAELLSKLPVSKLKTIRDLLFNDAKYGGLEEKS
jgi:hypothetical protein